MTESSMTPREIKEKGLLIIYTGEGKGKTSAALGMVYRALGWNLKVAVIQFIKGKSQNPQTASSPPRSHN